MFVLKRNISKKDYAGGKERYKNDAPPDRNKREKLNNDSLVLAKGVNIDYTKFRLYIRFKPDSTIWDSIDVVHTSQYKTIIEIDQSRLDAKLDTTPLRKIMMIYIYPARPSTESVAIIRKRNRSIYHYLHHSGIPKTKIRVTETRPH